MATQELSARPLEWNPPRQAISRVPYLPGLDGMRALAVVAVMLYHTNNGWMPGGFIGVHTGLLLAAQTESEFASVIGHEIAHVLQRHMARQYDAQSKISKLSLIAMAIGLLAARSNPQVRPRKSFSG